MICLRQNDLRDAALREASPLLPMSSPVEAELLDEDMRDDKTDFEIPSFRYTY